MEEDRWRSLQIGVNLRGEQGQSAGTETVLSRASVLTEHSLAQPPQQPLPGHDRGTAPPWLSPLFGCRTQDDWRGGGTGGAEAGQNCTTVKNG